MGEGLREVPQVLAGRARLFRVQAEVVRVAEHLLEDQPRLADPVPVGPPGRAHQGLNQPEGADVERPLVSGNPVRRPHDVVAVHEAVGDEAAHAPASG